MEQKQEQFFSSLPLEIWFSIMKFLDFKSVLNLDLVAKGFKDLARNPAFWQIYSTPFKEDYLGAFRINAINQELFFNDINQRAELKKVFLKVYNNDFSGLVALIPNADAFYRIFSDITYPIYIGFFRLLPKTQDQQSELPYQKCLDYILDKAIEATTNLTQEESAVLLAKIIPLKFRTNWKCFDSTALSTSFLQLLFAWLFNRTLPALISILTGTQDMYILTHFMSLLGNTGLLEYSKSLFSYHAPPNTDCHWGKERCISTEVLTSSALFNDVAFFRMWARVFPEKYKDILTLFVTSNEFETRRYLRFIINSDPELFSLSLRSLDVLGVARAIYAAVINNNLYLFKMLICDGSILSENRKKEDYRIKWFLHAAVKAGNLEMVNLLILHGEYVNEFDNHLRTPLRYAIEANNIAITQILWANGANLKLLYAVTKKTIYSCLEITLVLGYYEIANFLFSKGARCANSAKNLFNESELLSPELLRYLQTISHSLPQPTTSPANQPKKRKRSETASLSKESPSCISYSTRNSFFTSAADPKHTVANTIIDFIFNSILIRDDILGTPYLLFKNSGTQVLSALNAYNYIYKPFTQILSGSDPMEILQIILSKLSDPCQLNEKTMQSLLHYFIVTLRIDVIEVLLKKGLNPNQVNALGITPAQIIIQISLTNNFSDESFPSVELLKLLLNYGAKICTSNELFIMLSNSPCLPKFSTHFLKVIAFYALMEEDYFESNLLQLLPDESLVEFMIELEDLKPEFDMNNNIHFIN